jgi:hypothetical protein
VAPAGDFRVDFGANSPTVSCAVTVSKKFAAFVAATSGSSHLKLAANKIKCEGPLEHFSK